MIKTNGAEFKRFYSDSAVWPENAWHEDEEVLVDGIEWGDQGYDNIPDTSEVRISGGGVLGLPNGKDVSFEAHFRAWKKCQTTSTILVECDVTKIEAVKAAIRAAGGKVL